MKKLIEMLKRHEGFRGQPYLDTVGKKTIGYGRNIDDVGFSKEEVIYLKLNEGRSLVEDPLLKEEAEYLLLNDIKIAISECKRLGIDFNTLSYARKSVVVDMMFNMGYSVFSKFKHTLKYIKERRYDDAAIEMLSSKWARQVHRRANELSKMMEEDRWIL